MSKIVVTVRAFHDNMWVLLVFTAQYAILIPGVDYLCPYSYFPSATLFAKKLWRLWPYWVWLLVAPS